MVYLHQLAHNDFILLDASQSTSQAYEATGRLKPASIVVRCPRESGIYYSLYSLHEFLQSLSLADGDRTLLDMLDLHEGQATPVLDAYDDAETAPLRCVILRDGIVSGVYDASSPVEERAKGPRSSRPLEKRRESAAAFVALHTEFPEKVTLSETAMLLVRLALETDEGSGVSLAAVVDKPVDVVVHALQGFTIEGSGEGKLRIMDPQKPYLQFKLHAATLGPGRIRVRCFQAGQALGALTLAATVVDGPCESRVQKSEHTASSPRLTSPPDLTLVVMEQQRSGHSEISFHLTAADPARELYWKPYGPVKLRMDPLQYFQEFFADIEGLPLKTEEQQAIAERKLALKGARLFQDILPEELRKVLWDLRQSIQSVQVLSDEPWIPWELLKPQGPENGRVVEGPFFCEAYAMTRWFPGAPRRTQIHLKNMAIVVPSDSGLPEAEAEREYLLALANGQRKVQEVPATYLDVIEALSQGTYDGWHFTGHGQFAASDPNRSPILLEGDQKLCAAEICGKVSNCGIPHPLVFLNACQIGRQALSLTGTGGWARSFIDAGAAGFVGSLWSVYDEAASQFAQAFYNQLLTGKPIGQAVRAARLAIRPLNNPTWLAYTVFADPLAAVQ